jgi:hypothetical protein
MVPSGWTDHHPFPVAGGARLAGPGFGGRPIDKRPHALDRATYVIGKAAPPNMATALFVWDNDGEHTAAAIEPTLI